MIPIPHDSDPVRPGLPELLRCCCAIAATPRRLARPRAADERLLASIVDAGLPKARAHVRLTVLPQSHGRAPTAFIVEGARRPARLALGNRAFLVEHPSARFVIDPSLNDTVRADALPELPLPLRSVVRPRGQVVGMASALDRVGLTTHDVDFALATHVHWDHVCGMLELPGSTVLRTSRAELDWTASGGGRGINVPVRPLAGRTFEPFELDGPPVLTFERSHDLFGDGSVVLVDMAGHTPGSVGALLTLEDERRVLLAGDAVWHRRQAELIRETAPFPGELADNDRDATFAMIHRLHLVPSQVTLLATHDRDASLPWVPAAFAR